MNKEKSGPPFSWPDNASAAVCMTYDDGLDCHIDQAAPDLENNGLRATFYCPGHSESLRNRMEAWRALAANGHEIGNHTLFHPCIKNYPGRESFDWVLPEYDLGTYSVDRIVEELTIANTLLHAVDGMTERTFAYTCCDHEARGQSFSRAISHLFSGARLIGEIPDTMEDYDVFLTPSIAIEDAHGDVLIDYVEEAAAKGTIAVFMFHSVGGGHLNVSRESHQQLCRYLGKNRDRIWTDTFLNAMKYISSKQ